MMATVDDELNDLLERAADQVQTDSEVISLLTTIRDRALTAGRRSIAAEAAYLQARSHLNQGEPAVALQLIEIARTNWLADGEQLKAARTDLGRMNVLDDLGRHREAVEVGEQLLQSLQGWTPDPQEHEAYDLLRAGVFSNLGVANGYLGDHAAALAAYESVEAIYKQLGYSDSLVEVAANRGVELLELGRFGEAIAALRDAAERFDDQHNTLFRAKCLAYEARAHLQLGDYLRSWRATEAASDLMVGQDATSEYARIQLVRAATLTSLNLLDESLGLYERLVDRFDAAQLRHDCAEALRGKARVLALLGRNDESAACFEQARLGYRAVSDEVQAALCDVELSRLGALHHSTDRVHDAVEVLAASNQPASYAEALLRRSEVEQAETALLTLDVLAELIERHDLAQMRWKQWLRRGECLTALGRSVAAQASFQHGVDAVEALRNTIAAGLDRLPFMIGRERLYQRLIQAMLDRDQVASADELVERLRARSLVEVLSGDAPLPVAVTTTPEMQTIYSELLREPSKSESTLRSAARSLEQPVASGELREPARARSVAALGTSCTVTYQFLDDELIAFVRRGDDVRVVRSLTDRQQLHNQLGRLTAQWRRFADRSLVARHQASLLRAVVDVLQHLHLALIAPLEVLDEPSLTFVPQGALAQVPFGALHDGTCHLVERMPVVCAPSRAAAAHARSTLRKPRRRLVLGVADNLAPQIGDEIAAIGSLRGSAMLRDEQATAAAMLRDVDDFDVIHVATHGISRPDNPLFSALRLGDGWLTAAEASGAELDGQLLILSTCSLGRQYGRGAGDELDGFPRALIAAGAGAVVVNLWPVQDDVARSSMEAFHLALRDQPIAHALRSSQLRTMQRHPHPYYWASSTLIGAPAFVSERLT